jgi:sulfate/thiosulfate transport system substrate-binding protein
VRQLSLIAAAVTFLSACAAPAASGETRLALIAYSTPREAYAELIRAFQATPDGSGVSFDESYGGSTEQARAVQEGLPADVVALSLEPDISSLVKSRLVDASWNGDPLRGMVTNSVVVLVVRKGNPRDIHDWADLVRPGVEVLTPNPFTSGGARWNLLAAYGAQLAQGSSPDDAVAYLRALFAHVPVQAKSAREALQALVGGKGDVMLAYENEAITAQHAGEAVDYMVPEATMLIENPVAVTARSSHPREASAFVNFLRTPQAQRVFGRAGYRPVLPEVAADFEYPRPARLFTIADLGGWPAVDARFFDRQSGIVAELFRSQGVAVDGQ